MFRQASVGNATIRNLGRCVWQLGALHQSSLAILRRTRGRFASTEAAPSSSTSGSPPLVLGDAKINKLVDDISSLSLLQAADLVSLLKVSRIRINEVRDVCRNCCLPHDKCARRNSAEMNFYQDPA
jgi:large subunit ribosomal protein L7/L12